MNWYAIHTQPQTEGKVERHIKRIGFETFFPHTCEWAGAGKHHSRLVRRALLTRYLFVQSLPEDLPLLTEYRIKQIGLICVVSPGLGQQASAIPQHVIMRLQDKCDPQGALHKEEANTKGFAGVVGDRVRFAEGNSFWGLKGEIKRVLGTAIVVELDKALMGQAMVTTPFGHVQEVIKA